MLGKSLIGREAEAIDIQPAAKPKKVLVAGGGLAECRRPSPRQNVDTALYYVKKPMSLEAR
jgi:hypothetical protein